MKSGNFNAYIPKKGDIIWINFDPQSGREQSGHRPAVVVSPNNYNRRVKRALVCPITSRAKGYSFEVEIPENLPVSGVVLVDQVKALDWQSRAAEFIGEMPSETLMEIIANLIKFLREV